MKSAQLIQQLTPSVRSMLRGAQSKIPHSSADANTVDLLQTLHDAILHLTVLFEETASMELTRNPPSTKPAHRTCPDCKGACIVDSWDGLTECCRTCEGTRQIPYTLLTFGERYSGENYGDRYDDD